MSKTVGRRRLRILLCATTGTLCLLLMAAVLLIYGKPYNPFWWLVMAVILAGAFTVPSAFAGPIEWVLEGYLKSDEGGGS